MSRRIILWRHGRTEWNLAGRVQGQTDVPLDDVGREQARESAARLATLGPTRIVTSDLRRAADTAAVLGALCGVEVETGLRLREMEFGAREGLTWAEAWEQMPDGMRAWVDGDESKIPGQRDPSSRPATGSPRRCATTSTSSGRRDPRRRRARRRRPGRGVLRSWASRVETWGSFGGLNNCAWSVLEEVAVRQHDAVADRRVERRHTARAGDVRRRAARFGSAVPERLRSVTGLRADEHGAMAQLVARFHGMEEVRGSNPLSSTTRSRPPPHGGADACRQRLDRERAEACEIRLSDSGRSLRRSPLSSTST